MKTGKLIEWLRHSLVMDSDNANNTIKLLKRGRKYKAIVDEMEEFLEPGVISEIPEGYKSSRHINIIKYVFNKIKRKHFPKGEPNGN